MGVSAWSSGDNPSEAWSNSYSRDFEARGGSHNPIGVAPDSAAGIAGTSLGAFRQAGVGVGGGGGGGGGNNAVQAFSSPAAVYRAQGRSVPTAAQGNPLGLNKLVVDAYPIQGGTMAILQGPGVGYGTTGPNNRGTVYTAADRAFGDIVGPASWVPGQHANAFNVYDPETGKMVPTHGFSEGEAWGEGIGMAGGLLAGVPLLGAIGGAIGRAADPVTPKGVTPYGNIPDYEGVFGGGSGSGSGVPAGRPGQNIGTERDSPWLEQVVSGSPWGRASAREIASNAPQSPQIGVPDTAPTPLGGPRLNPYPGDYLRYGFGPQHRFFTNA